MGKVYPFKASFSLYLRTIQAEENPRRPMKAEWKMMKININM